MLAHIFLFVFFFLHSPWVWRVPYLFFLQAPLYPLKNYVHLKDAGALQCAHPSRFMSRCLGGWGPVALWGVCNPERAQQLIPSCSLESLLLWPKAFVRGWTELCVSPGCWFLDRYPKQWLGYQTFRSNGDELADWSLTSVSLWMGQSCWYVSNCLVEAQVRRNDTGVKVRGREAVLPTLVAALLSCILKSIQGFGLPCYLAS